MTTAAEAARARIEREACMRAITNFANVLHVSPEEAALIEGVRSSERVPRGAQGV